MSYFSQFTNRQALPNRVFSYSSSGNWVAPTAGWVTIAVVGAGGGGAANAGNEGRDKATGGGAGGFTAKTFYTPAGATYVITIGAGGAGAASGGITTVNGTLCSLTCNSGAGGVGNGNELNGAAGGVGGNATGGDFNYTGGRGGTIFGSGQITAATGGGAVSINGVAYNGGDANASANSVTISNGASGGGGVGGSGGSLTPANSGFATTGGGGSGGPAMNGSEQNVGLNATNYFISPGGAGSPAVASAAPFLMFSAEGGVGTKLGNANQAAQGAIYASYRGGVGAGGGGIANPLSILSGGNSAGFGGGGGAALFVTNIVAGGNSAMGGGGGGAAFGTAGSFLIGGRGGQGGVFIGFYGNNT